MSRGLKKNDRRLEKMHKFAQKSNAKHPIRFALLFLANLSNNLS